MEINNPTFCMGILFISCESIAYKQKVLPNGFLQRRTLQKRVLYKFVQCFQI